MTPIQSSRIAKTDSSFVIVDSNVNESAICKKRWNSIVKAVDPDSEGPGDDDEEENEEDNNFLDESDEIPEDNFTANTVILTPWKQELNNSFEHTKEIHHETEPWPRKNGFSNQQMIPDFELKWDNMESIAFNA